jgi:hypothetical protein
MSPRIDRLLTRLAWLFVAGVWLWLGAHAAVRWL